MKLMSCLALEHSDNSHDQSSAYDGFLAGFLVARDMMVKAIKAEVGSAGLPTIGCNPNMGEEEV